MAEIKINNRTFKVERSTLRVWVGLNALQEKMKESISKRDYTTYSELVSKYVEMASGIEIKIAWDKVPWFELLEAYVLCTTENLIRVEFPILSGSKKSEKLPWEYDGREWHFWLNLFASNYGWDEARIGNLDIDTAIGLYQEISIEGQLDREWWWGLSEIAYPYDTVSKTQKFKPLDRPDWMLPITPQPKKVKIRQDMLPVGQVINLTEKDETSKPS